LKIGNDATRRDRQPLVTDWEFNGKPRRVHEIRRRLVDTFRSEETSKKSPNTSEKPLMTSEKPLMTLMTNEKPRITSENPLITPEQPVLKKPRLRTGKPAAYD
jgi:hypothetical protein